MRKIILFSLLFFIFTNYFYASVDTASEYILMDMTTGMILDGKNYNEPKLISSITNIMTI